MRVVEESRAAVSAMRCLAVPSLLIVLCSACSSSDGTAGAATSTPAVAAPSSSATTETSVSPESSSPTSTAGLPSSTIALATTTAAIPDLEPQVRAAMVLAQQTFSDCLGAMPTCDPSTLAAARSGELLERNVARIEEWNQLGYAVRDRDQFRFVIEDVTIDASMTAATVTVCVADGSKLVQPGAAPDGSDVVIDDAYVSGRSTWDLRLDDDGTWRAYGTSPIGESSTEDVCGPA